MTDMLDRVAALTDKAAVIVGGAGGLGRGISLALAHCGVRVAILDRDEAALAELDAQWPAPSQPALLYGGDAREPVVLDAFYARVDDMLGAPHILVNVVGGTFNQPFLDTGPKGWDALLRTNLLYVLNNVHRAASRMKAAGHGGSIVNITSIEAHRANPNQAVYAAAKAAVESFSRTIALELGPDNIRVNCVAPDMVPTDAMVAAGWIDTAGPKARLNQQIAIPMGRYGTVDDIAHSVLFLASGLSSYITGATLFPDGGVNAARGWFNWPGGYSQAVPADILTHLNESRVQDGEA